MARPDARDEFFQEGEIEGQILFLISELFPEFIEDASEWVFPGRGMVTGTVGTVVGWG